MTDNHLSELERKAQLADELVTILNAAHWSATERVALMAAVVNAPKRDGSNWREVNTPTLQDFAKVVGLSDKTTSDAFAKFESVNLGSKRVERVQSDDGLWHASTTLAIKAELPTTLPALSDSANQKRTRVVNDVRRREFAEIKTKLDNILSGVACPHCGEVGHLHGEISATCSDCGAILDESELAELVDGQDMPASNRVEIISDRLEQPENRPENFSDRLEATEVQQKLRKLTGKNTRTVVDDEFAPEREAGVSVEVTEPKNFPDIYLESEKFSVRTEAPSAYRPPSVLSASNSKPSRGASGNVIELPSLADDAILTGADTLQWFADAGGDRFTLAEHRGKAVKERDWPNNPHTLKEAQAHLAQGGNVGWVGSGELVLLDADFNAASFATTFAQRPAISFRRDAWPERGKVVVQCSDPENLKSEKFKLSPEDRKPVFEVLASGAQGVIAGIHESGATVCLWAGEVTKISAAEIRAHCIAWLNETYPASEYPNATWRASRLNTPKPRQQPATDDVKADEVDKLSYSTQVEQAIAWFNDDEQNQNAMLDYVQRNFTTKGNYASLRADDRTPSAFLFANDALVDYGEFAQGQGGRNGVTDCFELHCMAHPEKDKRRHCFEVVNLWRASLGAKQLPDVRK